MAFNPDGLSAFQMYHIFTDEAHAFNFAFEADLLADETYCQCGGVFHMITDISDKFHCRVRCSECRVTKSILEGTIFIRSKLQLNQILYRLRQKSDKVFKIENPCFNFASYHLVYRLIMT